MQPWTSISTLFQWTRRSVAPYVKAILNSSWRDRPRFYCSYCCTTNQPLTALQERHLQQHNGHFTWFAPVCHTESVTNEYSQRELVAIKWCMLDTWSSWFTDQITIENRTYFPVVLMLSWKDIFTWLSNTSTIRKLKWHIFSLRSWAWRLHEP